MKRSTCILVLVAAIAMSIVSASGQAPDKQDGFLSILKKDQPVVLKEIAGRFEITLMEAVPGPLTHKVIEVETDYLVIEDIAEAIKTRIPVYSIKSVASIKTRKN